MAVENPFSEFSRAQTLKIGEGDAHCSQPKHIDLLPELTDGRTGFPISNLLTGLFWLATTIAGG